VLKRLIIEDFKTHKKTDLEFSSGINVITGISGHGKTNILLGLNLVVNNRPLGSSYIRRGQDNCTVTAEVDMDSSVLSIVRKKGKLENSYILKEDEVNLYDPFTAFGNSPPKEIIDVFNLSDINVQKQRDPYFLVYTSPGQVATYIRAILKLDRIDRIIKSISHEIHSEKSEIVSKEEELKSINAQLIEINKIDFELFEEQIIKIKHIDSEITRLENKIKQIDDIIGVIQIFEDRQIVLPSNINQLLGRALELPDKIVQVQQRIDMLKSLIVNIKRIETNKIVLPENLETILTDRHVADQYNYIRKQIEVLAPVIEEIRNIKLKISDNNIQLKQLRQEEKQLKGKLEICPSCGMELTEKAKIHLLEEGEN